MTMPPFEYIRTLWAEFLRVPVERIEPGSNYFQLGGYSLLAFEICARIERDTGTAVTADALLRFPAIDEFARHVEQTCQRGATDDVM